MANEHAASEARLSYDAPSLTVVGDVRGLTAGPVTTVGESPGGFHSNKRHDYTPVTENDES